MTPGQRNEDDGGYTRDDCVLSGVLARTVSAAMQQPNALAITTMTTIALVAEGYVDGGGKLTMIGADAYQQAKRVVQRAKR